MTTVLDTLTDEESIHETQGACRDIYDRAIANGIAPSDIAVKVIPNIDGGCTYELASRRDLLGPEERAECDGCIPIVFLDADGETWIAPPAKVPIRSAN